MTSINAIAKVRFSSAKAQRVHLLAEPPVPTDLLCLEADQQIDLPGPGVLYVVTGSATLVAGANEQELPTGHLVSAAEGVVANRARGRLVCLLFQAVI